MTLQITNRLITAVLAAAVGLLVAALAGRAEAAILVMPWAALLVLGLSGARPDRIRVALALERDRVIVDTPVTVEAEVSGLDGGWVEAVWRPPAAFATRPNGQPGSPTDAPVEERSDDANGSEGGEHGSDDGPGPRPDDPVDRSVTAIGDATGPDGTITLTCRQPAVAWGSHDVGRLEIRVHHPFGLTVASGLARQPLPVRVHPRPIDLRQLLAPWHVRRLTGAHRSRAAARGVEYADIRPYGPGDSPRDINWRASARSQELLVSQRHPDRSTHAILLIDSFADSGVDLPAVLGETIEAALALSESHLSVSDRVGLIDLGGIIRWVTPGSGRHHLQRLVDALLATRLYRSEAERSVTTLPARALPPRSFVLALSPLLDRRFVDALTVLRAAGHDVALVELAPVLDATAPRWDRTEVSALALRLWQAERSLTRDTLAEHGIAVAVRPVGIEPTTASASTGLDGSPRVDGEPGPVGREPWDRTLRHLTTIRRGMGPAGAAARTGR